MRIAIQADALASLKPSTDSTLLLIEAAYKRGYEVFYYTPDMLAASLGQGTLTARGAWCVTANKLGTEEIIDLTTMQVVLVRQDPPFNLAYLTTTYLLSMLPAHIQVINPPAVLREFPEKLAIAAFPDSVPPTLISRDQQALTQFYNAHQEIILKPLYAHGGQSVFQIRNADHLAFTITYMLSKYDHPVVAQAFLPGIRGGDTRLTFLNGEFIAALRRVPADGDIRSNLAMGATVEPLALEGALQPLVEKLSDWLRAQHIMLAGIDLVGDKLMEINVTSPTLLPAIKKHYDIDVAEHFWDQVEARIKLH